MESAETNIKHRSCFDLHAASNDVDPLGEVAEQLVGWFLGKEERWENSPAIADFEREGANPLFWDYAMPKDYTGGQSPDFWPALLTRSTADEEGSITSWTVEYDEPDATYEGRRWRTTARVERLDDGGCRFATESICYLTEGAPEELAAIMATPPFVRNILQLEGCTPSRNGVRLFAAPQRLDDDSFDDFATQVADPDRPLPLVLFSTDARYSATEYAKQLSRRSMGTANVYILDRKNFALSRRVEELLGSRVRIGIPAVCHVFVGGKPTEAFGREDFADVSPSECANLLAREFLYRGETGWEDATGGEGPAAAAETTPLEHAPADERPAAAETPDADEAVERNTPADGKE